jgi:hypothetical protein
VEWFSNGCGFDSRVKPLPLLLEKRERLYGLDGSKIKRVLLVIADEVQLVILTV